MKARRCLLKVVAQLRRPSAASRDLRGTLCAARSACSCSRSLASLLATSSTVEGTEQDAALHWPSGTAIGKLNLVLAEGKEPRIVLDSSVCGLNPSVHLPERVALRSGADVQRSFLSDDCFAQLCAVFLDFKAAHKCCKVLPKDQGTLLFRHRGALYHYTVCHFGTRFSAYWWQRTGSLMLRCLHALLCKHQHRAWLYVNDLLLLLRMQEVEVGAALTVALLGAINAPINWKKAQFAQQVVWCGWQFCFASEYLRTQPCAISLSMSSDRRSEVQLPVQCSSAGPDKLSPNSRPCWACAHKPLLGNESKAPVETPCARMSGRSLSLLCIARARLCSTCKQKGCPSEMLTKCSTLMCGAR